jgi:hypothetical protein
VAHPKDIGDRTTLAVMLALQERGYAILVPYGENTRYDLVIDDGQRLARVQCKRGRLRNGVVVFATCGCYGHHRNPQTARRSYVGQVDYFAVHCPETAMVYLVPIEDAPNATSAFLRVAPSKNNQLARVRFAAQHEIAAVIVSATGEPGATSGAGGSSA